MICLILFRFLEPPLTTRFGVHLEKLPIWDTDATSYWGWSPSKRGAHGQQRCPQTKAFLGHQQCASTANHRPRAVFVTNVSLSAMSPQSVGPQHIRQMDYLCIKCDFMCMLCAYRYVCVCFLLCIVLENPLGGSSQDLLQLRCIAREESTNTTLATLSCVTSFSLKIP